MKAVKKNNVLEGIKKEQLKRRNFTLEFKAEVVRLQHLRAVHLKSLIRSGRLCGGGDRADEPGEENKNNNWSHAATAF